MWFLYLYLIWPDLTGLPGKKYYRNAERDMGNSLQLDTIYILQMSFNSIIIEFHVSEMKLNYDEFIIQYFKFLKGKSIRSSIWTNKAGIL